MSGGYREGAGRKQGFAAKNAEEARKLLSERVAQEIGPITDILISRAKEGDIKAIRELFDRAWGRPSQALQHSLDGPTIGLVLDALEDEEGPKEGWVFEAKKEPDTSTPQGGS